MIYFKHYTDSHRGRSIQTLLDRHGHSGLIYWTIVEMCAEKLYGKELDVLREDDCVFSFHKGHFQSILRMKWFKIELVLSTSQECNLFSWECSGNEIIIKMPKLLEYLDYDQKRPRNKSATSVSSARLEEKRREEKNTDTAAALFNLWNKNCGKLPRVKELTEKRIKLIRSRLKEEPDLNTWSFVIGKLAKSDFCNGKGSTGWVADFDFLLKPDTRTKTIEGKYDNRGAPVTQSGFNIVGSKTIEEMVAEYEATKK